MLQVRVSFYVYSLDMQIAPGKKFAFRPTKFDVCCSGQFRRTFSVSFGDSASASGCAGSVRVPAVCTVPAGLQSTSEQVADRR